MSDAIREEFEAWFDKEFDPEITLTMEDKEMCFEAWQAALQSQTAPAMPGVAYSLHHVSRLYQVMRQYDSTIDDVALDSMRDTLRYALSSTDHIADAGKVAPSDWAGWACHKAGKMPRLYGEKSIAEVNFDTENGERLIFLSSTPSVPKEEIASKAIAQFKDELVNSVKPIFRPHIEGVCAVVIARLRTAGDEEEAV